MATMTLEIDYFGGLTNTLRLRVSALGSSAYIESNLTITEDATVLGVYRGNHTGTETGAHRGRLYDSAGNDLGMVYFFNLANATDTYRGQLSVPTNGVVGSVTAAITLPTIPTDWITAAGIATDAIGASELAASAVAEIQSGLASSAALTTVQSDTDDIQSRLPAALVGGKMDSTATVTGTVTLAASQPNYAPAVAGDAMTLTTGERTSIGTAVWATTARSLTTFGALVSDIAIAVWGAATRILTAGTNIVLAKGTGVTGLNDIAAGSQMDIVNAPNATAVTAIQSGLATAANLALVKADTAAIKLKTDNIPSDPTGLANLAAAHGSGSYQTATGFATVNPDNTGIANAASSAATAATQATAANSATTTILARIGAFTGSGLNTILGFMRAMMSKAASLTPSDVGGTFDNTTDSGEAIRDRGDVAWITGAGAGTGARVVTITVNDGGAVLENALIRMTSGAETYTASTNVSGVAVFALDDGTFTVSITKSGYSHTPVLLIVNGAETATYSMTLVTIAPSAAGLLTGWLVAYDQNGTVESGVEHTLSFSDHPTSGTGISFDQVSRVEASAANGLVQWTGLIPAATYRVRRGAGPWQYAVAVDSGNGTFPLIDVDG